MRERERLEDFRGGGVACRGCRRVLHFPAGSAALGDMAPRVCCGFAYVPTERQVDLIIYEGVQPGDVGAEPEPEAGPVYVQDSEVPLLMEEAREPEAEWDQAASDAEVDSLLASPQQIEQNFGQRMAEIRKRGR